MTLTLLAGWDRIPTTVATTNQETSEQTTKMTNESKGNTHTSNYSVLFHLRKMTSCKT